MILDTEQRLLSGIPEDEIHKILTDLYNMGVMWFRNPKTKKYETVPIHELVSRMING